MTSLPDAAEACAYCKLPVPGRPRGSCTEGEGPLYCCYGCRFAADVAGGDGTPGASRATLTRLGLAVFFSMNVMVFTMALWTLDIYEVESGALAASYHGLFRHLTLLAALPVIFLLGLPLFGSALDEARRGRWTSDLLLSVGVVAASGYSTVSTLLDRGQVYFEVACAILVLVSLGRWLEAVGKLRTTEALDALEQLLPSEVARLRDGLEERVALASVAVGDMLRIRPGERFPTDGRLLETHATVDEQLITGESRPVEKSPGDVVHGGTLNIDADLRMEVVSERGSGTLERLVVLMREARASKGRYQRLADRVSAAFFPWVLGLALLAGLAHASRSGVEAGFMIALAVVLIACPCALALATPMAVWAALGVAANHQVLFRNGEALERLSEVKAVRFDKTGTLTTGSPRLSRVVATDECDRDELWRRAGRLARTTTHALARVIVRECPGPLAGEAPTVAHTLAGLGVVLGPLSSPFEAMGNTRLMETVGYLMSTSLLSEVESEMAAGRPIVLVGWDGRIRGLFAFEEELRTDARAAVADCRALGLDVAVLTGDHAARGASLAEILELAVVSALSPEEKVAQLEEARARFGPVAMVGDGINDAPALASSDVGIAMGCGADLARDSAQVCLLGDDPCRVAWSVALARRTVRVVRQNLAWSFGYNAAGVAAAAAGWLNPALAAALMVASSLLVVVNSLRLSSGALGRPAALPPRSEAAGAAAGRVVEGGVI